MARAKKAASKGKGKHSEENLPLDAVLTALEEIVGELEGGDLPLEQALERFEVGVRHARRAGAMLDAVEQRVEVLLAEQAQPVAFDEQLEDA